MARTEPERLLLNATPPLVTRTVVGAIESPRVGSGSAAPVPASTIMLRAATSTTSRPSLCTSARPPGRMVSAIAAGSVSAPVVQAAAPRRSADRRIARRWFFGGALAQPARSRTPTSRRREVVHGTHRIRGSPSNDLQPLRRLVVEPQRVSRSCPRRQIYSHFDVAVDIAEGARETEPIHEFRADLGRDARDLAAHYGTRQHLHVVMDYF